jgi:PAS domain S-box-containing protein
MSNVEVRGSTEFLADGGETGKLMRSLDWSATSLPPPQHWPQSLRSAISICLGSSFPIAIYWGPDFDILYNDAFIPIVGGKHPRALGRPGREVWSEIWDAIGPQFDAVVTTGEAGGGRDGLLPLRRHGYREECYFDYTLTPIRGEGNRVEGIFNGGIETTYRVINERRGRTLRDLTERTTRAQSVDNACALAIEALAAAPKDVPFCLLYLLDPGGHRALLAGAAGLPPGSPASPAMIDVTTEQHAGAAGAWPITRAAMTGHVEIIDDLGTRFGVGLSGKAWREPCASAIVVPLMTAIREEAPYGFLIAGVSPRRALDDDYRGFFELVAEKIAIAIGNARAHQDVRARAEALAELDRAKTAFFSNASHEFRTPLSLILGTVEDALREDIPGSSAQRSHLEIAHRNARRLLRLVNTLLDFSRIEAGRGSACFEPVDLAALTVELASNFHSLCATAGLRFVVDCRTLPRAVYLDREMWEKIVLNLVSNAFKFTFQGEIVVSVRVVGDGHVEFAVRDTGTGIAEHELPRLFDRFHRVEGARGRSYEGSGIGLALVQELAKLHGGMVTVESRLDHGSVFRVTIPLGTAHLPPEQIRSSSPFASTAVPVDAYIEEASQWLVNPSAAAPLSVERPDAMAAGPDSPADTSSTATRVPERPRILFADDDADMRAYVGRILAEKGYEVRTVADGAAALAAVRERLPDLVLSDAMMPLLDGFGLLRALRADPATAALSVVLLSARAGEESQIEGIAAGADDYLVKPFSARELVARVDGAVRLARLRRAAAAREHDLTAEIAAERSRAALHESEARLAYALEAGKLGSWDLDLTTGLSMRSAAHDRIFGYQQPVADWSYETFMQHVLPDDRDQVDRSSRVASAQRAHWHVECRIRRTDGEVRWIEIHGSPQGTTEAGAVARFSGVVQDITERKLAWEHEQRAQRLESEIRVSEEKYRLLREKAHDAILVLDQHGIVLEANPSTEAISGLAHDDIVGRSLFLAATDPEQQERLRELLASDQTGTTQLRLSGGGGRLFDVEVSATRTSADDQDIVLLIARDITQRLLLEQQLRQSQKMDAIGQLTGGVAHDFNNILTVITGSIDLLVDDLADRPDLAGIAMMIGEAATRATNLIGQLLAFARKQALQPHDTDINRLIVATTSLLRPTLGEEIEINAMLEEGCWHAMIDPSQLSTALLNLAVNARDAMSKGGRLTLGSANVIFDDAYAEANPEVKPGAYVMIFVTDTGTGIPHTMRDRVFEPFFTTKEVGRGTGLGLSMVYGFVKQSGGHIKISGEEGRGTTIEIYLPRSGEAAATSEPAVAGGPQGCSETILVVEDDALVRHYAVTQLQSLGYATISAAKGSEALELVEGGAKFDLLFTDVIMPGGMNGRQLADEIARRRPGIPVLFTSGYPESAIVHNGQLDPGVALLGKPYRKPDLARMICEALARRADAKAA